MGLAPSVANAAAKPGKGKASKGDEADEAALAEAKSLYDEGKARFDTFDYEGAVDMWTKAYAKLPEDASGMRNAMVYNIATAQEKAYDLDKDLQHLRQAVLLLETYVTNYKAMFAKTPETTAEVEKAENRIATLEERIGRAERGEPEPVPVETGEGETTPEEGTEEGAEGDAEGIVWNTGHNPPADPAVVDKNRRLAEADAKTDKILIASYVLLGVGGFILVSGASALAGGQRATDAEAELGLRSGGYGGLALGGAAVITGAVLLGVGLDRRKRARAGTLVAATPVVAPGFAGASVRVRF